MAARGRRNYELLQKEISNGQLLVENATEGCLQGVKELLDSGASVNAEDYNRCLFYKSKNYMTPLQCAAKSGHADIVNLLIHRGAYVDAKDRFDVTALHLAAENGQVRCLALLLENGADWNSPTKYSKPGSYTAVPHVGGTTALHLATKHNHMPCIKELILNGADYNATDELGQTSLYVAAQMGFEEAVLAHLQNAVGRDILSLPIENTGETPLHECIRHGSLECVRELIGHGSDVNHRNSMGFSPLHLACHNRSKFSFEILKELIISGYEVDINLAVFQNDVNAGLTPLHYVCFNTDNVRQERRPQVAAFLIAYGAQFVQLKNKHGCSLIQQELRAVRDKDRAILQAIVKTIVRLPSLASLVVHSNDLHTLCADKCRWYSELSASVRSLQHHCRCSVRGTMGARRLQKVRDLPLPATLKDYLLLDFDEYR